MLLPGRLFSGPHGAPTLEGRYVLKDFILVAAGMVIAAVTFRGGRLVRGDLAPASRSRVNAAPDAEQKLRIVLDGVADESRIPDLCEQNHISQAEFYDWRELSLEGATAALEHEETRVPVASG